MVMVRERQPEMALMSERSQGVNVYTAGSGQGKKPSSFGAHYLYFLITLCRWYDKEYTRSKVSAYQRWLNWPDSRDYQCTLTYPQEAG